MTSTELTTTGSPLTRTATGTLALGADQDAWTEQQGAALKQMGIDKAPRGDQMVFMHVCQRTQLDPFARQIYMIERGGKWTIQTGIDGFRVMADRREEYGGQTAPQWCGKDGQWVDIWVGPEVPHAARVGIIRTDWREPVWGIAIFSEFTAGNAKWKTSPAHMIAKCAEAGGFRKAFPQDFSGLSIPEENDRDLAGPIRASTTAAPATVHELTGGTPVPAGDDAAGRATPDQMGKLFPLLREADIANRNEWASGILGREIGSFGELSVTDAGVLIDRIQQGLDALVGEATS